MTALGGGGGARGTQKASAAGLALGVAAGLAIGYALFHEAPVPSPPTPVRKVAAARPDAPRVERRDGAASPAVEEDGEAFFDPDKAAEKLEDRQADEEDEEVTVTGVREVEGDASP